MSLLTHTETEAKKINRVEVTPVSRVAENGNALTLTVELPGVNENEIELTVEHRTLSIKADNSVQRFKDHTLILTEIPEVCYRAAFDLPERVDTAGIKAASRNGLLVLTLPKREEVKPRRIEIAAG
jgi:HSP20 family molecular chaperone IbpA